MQKLNYEWISDTFPNNIAQQNINAFCFFPDDSDPSDGFLHLLGKTIANFPIQGSFTCSADAPYQFFYVYEGMLTVTIESSTYTLPSGTAALLPAYGCSTLRIEKARCRYFHMYLSGLALDTYHRVLAKPFRYSTDNHSVLSLSGFLDRMADLDASEADFLFCSKISMWLTDLFTEMMVYKERPETKREAIPKYITQLHDRFETNYNESFTLDELEEIYSISKYRICREFAKYYGQSPIQFLNHTRMKAAQNLLLTTDASIHEIGNMVGIPNTNHFINLFKRETGATPLTFKQDAPVSISELHFLS